MLYEVITSFVGAGAVEMGSDLGNVLATIGVGNGGRNDDRGGSTLGESNSLARIDTN